MNTKIKSKTDISKKEAKFIVKIGKELIKKDKLNNPKYKNGLDSYYRVESRDNTVLRILISKGMGFIKIKKVKDVILLKLTAKGKEVYYKNKHRGL